MIISHCKKRNCYVLSFSRYIIRSAFQEIVNSNGNVMGYEALSRIEVASTGAKISPDVFFSNLKDNVGYIHILLLINKLHLISYRDSRLSSKEKTVFLNLPPGFFELILFYPQIADSFVTTVKQLKMTTSKIVIEITEEPAISEISLGVGKEMMSDRGFKIALDDYGDESSSLERYKICLPEIVKISRNFFLRQKNANSYDELNFVTSIFRHYNSKVLVEGVEYECDYEALKLLGIDYFQGFLFHKPEHTTIDALTAADCC